ncbi:cilia- and flagella-associated protein 44-like, partial [Saccoglossus kowalevskii]|uniref:WD repeat-containing protein 52-like n=1 Tax=Saccoglossus kowalevskii TaxID=10224 RepID=A0ABM0LYK5_SACKO
TVRVYDYISKTQLCQMKFSAGGSVLAWLPQIMDPKGATIVAGFDDGVVRVLNVYKKELKKPQSVDQVGAQLVLKQVFKPHSKKVKALAVDSKGELLATGVSDHYFLF